MDTKDIVKTFSENVKSVKKLVNFDNQVITLAIDGVEELHKSLVEDGYKADSKNGANTLTMLKSVKEHNSLKASYQIIQNQAVVLLVSYFGSAVSDLFRVSSTIAVDIHKDKRVLDVDLKLQVRDVMDLNSSMGEGIGELLISKNSISFQDMKSIRREFEDYFNIIIEKDKNVKNIILGQACRHLIVHEGGRVNKKAVNQVREANPRDLKQALKQGEIIEFTEEEIQILSDSMVSYVKGLAEQVDNYKNSPSTVENEKNLNSNKK
jgi:hypothetical protein